MVTSFPAEQEPDGDVLAPHHFYVGLLLAWFGFMFIWPTYPVTGSLSVLVGLLIAADDAISHALGVWTPIDWVWRRFIRPRIP